MLEGKELVSIVTPSFNTANFIGKTIESVLAQTYQKWEMIIVDDGSSDNTDNVVKPYLTDRRIRYLKNPENCGAAISRNTALREAKGHWIAFLDSDDIWEPTKLEKQIRFMSENGFSFSYTGYIEMDELGLPSGVCVSGPNRITSSRMQKFCWPGCLTVMYDQTKIGLIQIKDIKKNNDYAMWIKISKIADCWLLNEKLARYRKRSGSISNHSITTLIKWHYKLWHEAEQKNVVTSIWLTIENLIFGVIKKLKYVERGKR